MTGVVVSLLAPIWKYLVLLLGGLIGGAVIHSKLTKTDPVAPVQKLAQTEASIAQAEANAPSSVTAVQARMDKGTF